MQKSQWKIDFLPIFSPIFQDFCHFIHLWNIPKFFGVAVGGHFRRAWGGSFEFGGLYKSLFISSCKYIKSARTKWSWAAFTNVCINTDNYVSEIKWEWKIVCTFHFYLRRIISTLNYIHMYPRFHLYNGKNSFVF